MYLMLKDEKVMYFDFKEFTVMPINNNLLPLYLRDRQYNTNTMQDILNNVQLIKTYLSRRVLSVSRDNAKQLYALFQISQIDDIDTRVKTCLMCRGVSIQDSYWVKEDNSNVKFDDINIRKNKLKDIVSIALYGENPSVTTNCICPELTTHGLFRKAWVRDNGELYLLKSDKHSYNINTRMEVLASKILCCFDNKIECIEYSGRVRNTSYGKIYVDKCKNFVNEDYSFVEAWEAIDYCITTGRDFRKYLGYSSEVASIPVLDFILNNTDRHTQNYGFLMCNSTGKIIGLAPLFDFNCALIADVYNKNASNTLSQMFNDGKTLIQLADEYRNYHNLVLHTNKFDKLISNNKNYENVLSNILKRCEYIGVKVI